MEVLENSISQRLKRNPNLLPVADPMPSTKKRSHTETITQQHELKFLKDKYDEHYSSISQDRKELVEGELVKLNDPSADFKQFDNQLAEIREQHELYSNATSSTISSLYDMFSSRPGASAASKRVKRKYILCKAASFIDIDSIFQEKEEYGRCLDLTKFYKVYQKMTGNEEISYVDYLSRYDRLPDTNIQVAGTMYSQYLEELYEYLVAFIRRAKPLETGVFDVLERLQPTNSDPVEAIVPLVDGSTNEAGEIFCKACDKWFAKETVYKGHLNGKKHLKNLKIP